MTGKLITTLVLILFVVLASVSEVKAAEGLPVHAIKSLIVKHSVEMGLDPALALSIAKQESGFCHERKSRYGAVGVFQLLPSTAKRIGYNPYRVQDNIKGGIAYYKMMYRMFGSMELALAAYNAGPGNVKKYKGVPPFSETRKFVSSIMNNYKRMKVNPDPAIAQYNSKSANETYTDEFDETEETLIDEEARLIAEQEQILRSYLEKQGI